MSEHETASGSPPRWDDPHWLAARALDVLVYLPAGALVRALGDVPETVAEGRARVDRELRNAKVVGRLAVDLGLRQLRAEVERATAGARRTGAATSVAPDAGAPPGVPQDPAARSTRGRGVPRPGSGEPSAASRHRAVARDRVVDSAIPDYDILAASQVVRRLGGLGADELEAVLRHERATRGRRTVVQRAEQLLAERRGAPGGPARPHGARAPSP